MDVKYTTYKLSGTSSTTATSNTWACYDDDSSWTSWASATTGTSSTYGDAYKQCFDAMQKAARHKMESQVYRKLSETESKPFVPVNPKAYPGKTYDLPDGAKLVIDLDGNYKIEDKDAKVTYKANRNREFSPYMNASDLLAQFVEYVATVGVKRNEVLNLPIHLFISWLIIEAAQRDGDELPQEVIPIPQDPVLLEIKKPKCLLCKRYIPKIHNQYRFPFCNPEHGQVFLAKKSPDSLIVHSDKVLAQ